MIVQTVIATDLITPLGAYLRLREAGSASFLLESVEKGRVHSRHNVIAGKIDRPSPVVESKITEINFNPYWNAAWVAIRSSVQARGS